MAKTVTIDVFSNIRARLVGEYPTKKLDRVLRFHPSGYQYMRAFKSKVWDGYVRIMQPNGSFPAGLATFIARKLKKWGYHVEIERSSKKPKLKRQDFDTLKGVKLYPDQRAGVRALLKAKKGIARVATGGGKTEMMAGVIKGLYGSEREGPRPPKTLVIVPNRNLLKQTAKRLSDRLGMPVGMIGYGKWEEDWVTVAIPDTLSAKKYTKHRKTLFKNCELLMFDECHHASSDKWYSCIRYCNAYYRYGFSGTPLDRGQGGSLRLMGLTGDLIVNIDTETLVKMNRLAKPSVIMHEINNIELPPDLSYEDAYVLGVVRNIGFHRKIVQKVATSLQRDPSTSVLVLVTRIEHGNNLSKAFEGIRHRFVHAKSGEKKIDKAIRKFKAGKLPVLIASPIFGEGTDIPNIDEVFVADGTKSVIRTVQKAGRALRKKKGKANRCRIHDFANFVHPTLLEHSYARLLTYKREGMEIIN